MTKVSDTEHAATVAAIINHCKAIIASDHPMAGKLINECLKLVSKCVVQERRFAREATKSSINKTPK